MVQNTLFKVAEVELTYKPNYKPSERPQIKTAKQAHEVFIAHWSIGKIEYLEEFKMLLLIEGTEC